MHVFACRDILWLFRQQSRRLRPAEARIFPGERPGQAQCDVSPYHQFLLLHLWTDDAPNAFPARPGAARHFDAVGIAQPRLCAPAEQLSPWDGAPAQDLLPSAIGGWVVAGICLICAIIFMLWVSSTATAALRPLPRQ